MDVKALKLLDEQEQAIKSLPKPSDTNFTVESFEEEMRAYLKCTNERIEDISKYVKRISEKLDKVGKAILDSSIKIGEQLQNLLSKITIEERRMERGRTSLPLSSNRSKDKPEVSYRPERTGSRGKGEATTKTKHSETSSNNPSIDQVLALQKLAEQQRKLLESIAKTQELIAKMARGSGLSMEDIDKLKQRINSWTETLETIEEKQDRIRREKEEKQKAEEEKLRKIVEEKRRKEKEKQDAEKKKKKEKERLEQERKLKEEEERNRKLKEKREKEENEKKKKEAEEREKMEREEEKKRKERERKEKEETERKQKEKEERQRREEEDKQRRDWRNWPMFVYRNKGQNLFGQSLMCVIRAMPNGIQKSDIICEGSDNVDDLYSCLDSNDETVLSSLVSIKPAPGRNVKFEMPIRVYLPISGHSSRLTPGVKYLKDKNGFQFGKAVDDIQIDGEQVDVVGIEIDIQDLKQLKCVAVARFDTEDIGCSRTKLTCEPVNDRSIQLHFKDGSFKETSSVSAKTYSHSYIFSSSRGRTLQDKVICREFVVRPGAKLLDLGQRAYHKLKNIEGLKIVYIMAGIPDITDRRKNVAIPYEESWLEGNSKEKLNDILRKLQSIFDLLNSIGCKVIFVPIATMSLELWNNHRKQIGKTKYLMYQKEYITMQATLNELVNSINRNMIEINTKNNMVTPFVHCAVHQCHKGKFKYAYRLFVDGLHPSDQLTKIWVKRLQHAIKHNEENNM